MILCKITKVTCWPMQRITPSIRWLLVVIIHLTEIDLLDSTYYLLIDWVGRLDRKIFGPSSWHTVCVPWPRAKYFPVGPNLTQSISILSYDHCAFPFFLSGNKICYWNIHSCRSFWPKSLYSNKVVSVHISQRAVRDPTAGLDSYFRPRSRHLVRPLYWDFLNSFAMKVRAGLYRSYVYANIYTFSIHWDACKKPNNLGPLSW